MKKILQLDWDLVAGILAAIIALVLHMLHIVNQEILLAVSLVLLTLLLVRDLRSERNFDRLIEMEEETQRQLRTLKSLVTAPDVLLIGPPHLRAVSESFSHEAHGDMIWFNVCLAMYRPQDLFDSMLKPAVENKRVTSIQFVVDVRQRAIWDNDVEPKLRACAGYEKVREPIWRSLPESVSFILAATTDNTSPEALLSFWGEPFMSHLPGRNIPRYIFRVLSTSELITRLSELERSYRLEAPAADAAPPSE